MHTWTATCLAGRSLTNVNLLVKVLEVMVWLFIPGIMATLGGILKHRKV